MKLVKLLALVFGLGIALQFGTQTADAGYGGWGYYNNYNYYYNQYYYTPTSYHYCIYYPSQPRYVYYYNPYQKTYWGRFDLQGKDGAVYSELAEKDRKGSLKEIPEEAFPAAGAMPKNPATSDGKEVEGSIPTPPAPPKEAPKDTPKN